MLDVIAGIADDEASLAPKFGKHIHVVLNRLRNRAYDRMDLAQFLAFALREARRSKAQLFQDLWALWMSGQKMGGYFVEFGGGDGRYLSNTWLLEHEFGWDGILAEPNPNFHKKLAANRKCTISHDCVYSASGKSLEFVLATEGELSCIAEFLPDDSHKARRIDNSVMKNVETVSLNDLLIRHDAPKDIDYMSVDTEGSEFEILSAFDFNRWNIASISVEHNNTKNRDMLFDLLTANGYERVWTTLSAYDDWYVRR
jgi:FkbM family methyltransferase